MAATTRRRLPLNPSDVLFYVVHRLMEQRGEGGYIATMEAEADGDVEPAALRDAVRHLLREHSVLMAGLRRSWLRRRPYYLLPRRPDGCADRLAGEVYRCLDLRSHADAEAELERLTRRSITGAWNVRRGPLVRLQHYLLPGGRSRLVLRWPHFLMDGRGAMWLLAEISRLAELRPDERAEHRTRLPAGLCRQDRSVDPLAGRSFLERLSLVGQAFEEEGKRDKLPVASLFPDGVPAVAEHRFLHHRWSPDRVRALQERAKRSTPAGPGIYMRWLVACVLRAVDRIYAERGIETGAYLLGVPVGAAEPGAAALPRPVHGNYLVYPILRIPRKLVSDREALTAEITRQIAAYEESGGALKAWAVVWIGSLLPFFLYQRLFARIAREEPGASGFSYLGENPVPLRTLTAATVRYLLGAGPVLTPPGWNPAFVRFGDTMNVSLTYAAPAIDDALAERFMDLIETEAFGSEQDEVGATAGRVEDNVQ